MEKGIVAGYIGKAKKNPFLHFLFFLKADKYKYREYSVSKDNLDAFLNERSFEFLCVGSPFKESVIKNLDFVSESVKNTRCCNFIINKSGALFGYNTEVVGFKNVIKKFDINLSDKSVLILGNGPTARSIKYALKTLGNNKVVLSGRNTKNPDEINYKEANSYDPLILINTTPTGKGISDKKLVHLSNFKKLETVIDTCENPYRTSYLIDAKQKGKGIVCGLEIAFESAKIASLLYNKICIPNYYWDRFRDDVLLRTINIVLIGLDHEYKRELCTKIEKESPSTFIDIKKIIEKQTKKSLYNYKKENKMPEYLFYEREVVKIIKNVTGKIINTTDYTPSNPDNVINLSKNGYIVYLKTTKFSNILSKNKKKVLVSAEEQRKNYALFNKKYEEQSDLTTTSEIDFDNKIIEICKAITGEK